MKFLVRVDKGLEETVAVEVKELVKVTPVIENQVLFFEATTPALIHFTQYTHIARRIIALLHHFTFSDATDFLSQFEQLSFHHFEKNYQCVSPIAMSLLNLMLSVNVPAHTVLTQQIFSLQL